MDALDTAVLSGLVFVAAALYSTVGHGGASGYLAAMALVGAPAAILRPTALVLNVLVSGLGALRFRRAGHLPWRGLWPFIVTSIPCAFIGGAIHVPEAYYRPLLGAVLFVAAANLLWRRETVLTNRDDIRIPALPAMASGAVIGILAGLTGVGGGIFLSPLIILMGWADTRTTAGISAAFILVNSIAGLAGNLASFGNLSPDIAFLAVAAFLGGLIGSWLGTRRLNILWMRRVLAIVLIVAGGKLILA